MAAPLSLLIRQNLKTWLTARGFWIVIVAALVPPALTGAWVGTHQNDVAVTSISWSPEHPLEKQVVDISATIENKFRSHADPFNVTIRVGYYQTGFGGQQQWVEEKNETQRVPGLNRSESRPVTINWTAQAGSYLVEVYADTKFSDEIQEIEELNNERWQLMQVKFLPLTPEQTPPPPGNLTGDPGSSRRADAFVKEIRWSPEELYEKENATFEAVVENRGPDALTNASVSLAIQGVTNFGTLFPIESPPAQVVNVPAGQSATVPFTLMGMSLGVRAVTASVNVSADAFDANGTDNYQLRLFFVDRKAAFPEPEEKATIKSFYRDILSLLHLRLLIPLIGLFYAAGVLEDEKERGNLLYLLTRPLPRWAIPITRFAVSFVVAGVAISFGILVTYLLLLGFPQAEPGYLYWPMLFSLLTLFVYGALFTLVGVVAERPYLIGLLYILAFEAFILVGRSISINGSAILQKWVENFSLSHWVLAAFKGWDPKVSFQVWPHGGAAVGAVWVLIGIGVGSLLLSALVMRRREFDV